MVQIQCHLGSVWYADGTGRDGTVVPCYVWYVLDGTGELFRSAFGTRWTERNQTVKMTNFPLFCLLFGKLGTDEIFFFFSSSSCCLPRIYVVW